MLRFLLLALLHAAPSFTPIPVHPLVKVRPGDPPPTSPDGSHLYVARGECEGLQLFVPPGVHGVTLRTPALKGPGSPLPTRLFREAYVRVTTPSNEMGAAGLWPDPLLPVQDDAGGDNPAVLPADSTAEKPLVLYLELCVPSGSTPGDYRGELVLRSTTHAPARIAVEATVWPFLVPATSSLPNTFGMSLYTLAHGHRLAPLAPATRALEMRYAGTLLSHRISAFGLSMEPPPPRRGPDDSLQFDFRDYDAEMGPLLSGTLLPSGARFTTADLRHTRKLSEAELPAYYRAVRDHFREKGWTAQLFYYAKDEPRAQDVPAVLAEARLVHAAGGGVPVLVTTPFDRALQPAWDILCPVLNCFFPRPGARTCKAPHTVSELRALQPGTRLWWYQSCMSHGCNQGPIADPRGELAYSRWASYMVDHPGTLNRAMGPLAFLAGIDGELYYDAVTAWDDGDPWEGVYRFGGNGDGTLLYPGTPEHLGRAAPAPVPSLRLKTIRDGLEDYEMLALLARTGDGPFAQRAVRRLVQSGWEITASVETWAAVHRALGERASAGWVRAAGAR